jgi:hypothetical protein
MVCEDKEDRQQVNNQQIFGLPADVVDDVEANERGEDESDGNGGGIDIEGQLAVVNRLLAGWNAEGHLKLLR